MAKPHWEISGPHPNDPELPHVILGYGCQNSGCTQKATWQWQRDATADEVAAEAALEGPYGELYRSSQGPHSVAVFSCDDHAFKAEDGSHHLDRLSIRHASQCTAPDPGCACVGEVLPQPKDAAQ